MKLNVPFYKNDKRDIHCFQIAMKSVIKYFLDKELDISELDKLTGRKNLFWTWPSQIVCALHEIGLDVIYFSGDKIDLYLKGEGYMKERYPDKYGLILERTDLKILINSIKKMLDLNLFERKILTYEDITSELKKGHIPIIVLDFNKLYHINEPYSGHAIVLTGFDENSFFYHESAYERSKGHCSATFEDLMAAADFNGSIDVILITGKRKTIN